MPIVAALARTIDFLIILRSSAGCGDLHWTYVDVRAKAARLVDHDRRTKRLSLFLQRVLEATDSVLDLAFDLVGLAVSLQLGIAGCLADGLLDRALDLFRRSRDPILVHDFILLLLTYVPCIRRRYNKGGAAAVASETTHTPAARRYRFCVSLWFSRGYGEQGNRARVRPSRLVRVPRLVLGKFPSLPPTPGMPIWSDAAGKVTDRVGGSKCFTSLAYRRGTRDCRLFGVALITHAESQCSASLPRVGAAERRAISFC